jgi:hypothetical protein
MRMKLSASLGLPLRKVGLFTTTETPADFVG